MTPVRDYNHNKYFMKKKSLSSLKQEVQTLKASLQNGLQKPSSDPLDLYVYQNTRRFLR